MEMSTENETWKMKTGLFDDKKLEKSKQTYLMRWRKCLLKKEAAIKISRRKKQLFKQRTNSK